MAATDQLDTRQLFSQWQDWTHRSLALQPAHTPPDFAHKLTLKGNASFEFSLQAFTAPKIRYARSLIFLSSGCSVFNFLAVPEASCDIPLLGIDVVHLGRQVILAVDFQPLSASNDYFQSPIYTANRATLSSWQDLLNTDIASIPAEARKYFSPLAVWQRGPVQPLSHTQHGQCIHAYIDAYSRALETCIPGARDEARAKFEREYLNYRTENDPARGILDRVFGAQWTQTALASHVFPLDDLSRLS